MPPIPASIINALLPQTQCGKCGFGGCLPYAEALAQGSTTINRCPPGGDAGIAALAALLDLPEIPLDPECGTEQPPRVARIVEAECIGCMKCILACPVDAIVGASKLMHTVIEAECTGCELCLAPCPVDCIEMVPRESARPTPARSAYWRARHEARLARLTRDERERSERLNARLGGLPDAG